MEPVTLALALVEMGTSHKIQEHVKKRADTARGILLEEIKEASKSLEEICENDEQLRLILRYSKAAAEGASTKNLRLLSQIIRGAVNEDDLNADRGIYLMNIVAELSEEELLLLKELDQANTQSSGQAASNTIERKVIGEGKLYPTQESYAAALARLLRTGLVLPLSVGTISYDISPLFEELIKLANLNSF